ncbi:MAG TPA: hypothetical protein VJU14_05015 [Solirubrobacterales bacterium]|nr:hypothetical protein [Solirubrobacterales bacterium]
MSAIRTAADFEASRAALERAVGSSCAGQDYWPRAIVAGIDAALEFAAESPGAAQVLTERAGERWKEREPRFTAMVERFARLLARGAPPANPRLPSPQGVVICIVKLVNLRIESGRPQEVRELAPDLAFLALLPFVGFAGAQRWSQLTAAA